MPLLLPLLGLHAAANAVQSANATFSLFADYTGEKFFEGFDFFTKADPTSGCVDFLGHGEAKEAGLIGVNTQGQVYMRTDNTTIRPSRRNHTARPSIRVTSKRTFDPKTLSGRANESGAILVVLDVAHMPTGCGVWPAFWMNSAVGHWPADGEIDVIEGVNRDTANSFTLHTTPGCSQASTRDSSFSGKRKLNKNQTASATDCYIHAPGQGNNQGCSIGAGDVSGTYGAPFNSAGGGVYVMLWTYDADAAAQYDGKIALWFFERGQDIPSDLLDPHGHPQPPTGRPLGLFHTGSSCPARHFNEQQFIFDITLCGQWAGNVFNHDCPMHATANMTSRQSCEAYVAASPSAFSESRWELNSLRVFSTSAPAVDGPPQRTQHWLLVFVALGCALVVLIACVVVSRRMGADTPARQQLTQPINQQASHVAAGHVANLLSAW